jgi:hypothetical protein
MMNRINSLVLNLIVAAAAAVSLPVAAADFTFVTTTDFASGSSSTINNAKTATSNVAPIHTDASSRFFLGSVYVVNRAGADNIQVLNPNTAFSTTIQFSTGNGSNPHDVSVFDATKCYVTRYDTDELWRMNPTTGAMISAISFASLSDADGLPEIDQLFQYRDRLFVSVQRLDRNNFYSPVGTSYLSVIDTNTDTIIDTDGVAPGTQSILLAASNPFSEIQLDYYTGMLYIACVGFFGVLDGGVATVDPETMLPGGIIFTEASAGGDILDVEITAPDKGFAIISTPSFNTELISFNPSTGVKTGTMYAPGAYVLQDIDRAPSGDLFLTDRTPTAPGIRCYDTETSLEITVAPIDVGLPPFELTFSLPTQTATDAPVASTSLGQNYPNPFNPSTSIPYTVRATANVRIDIFDAVGKRVATVVDGVRAPGTYVTTWDGLAPDGRKLSSGVYFSRLTAGNESMVRKLILVK